MIRESALRGYLLEEALAWLLQGSAYELLVSADQDRVDLEPDGAGIRVRGRGATHQVDVLGEFAFTPAFSLPIRLFLEAKFQGQPCGLPVVRNALGTIQDVNQNYASDGPSTRPRRRFQYCYALFSTRGFTREAQEFALAHQLSLIDLSGDSYARLRDAISEAAQVLRAEAVRHRIISFPVTWTRTALRAMLGTVPQETLPDLDTNAPQFRSAAEPHLMELAEAVEVLAGVEMLLGFPAAPFIVPLATSDRRRFTRYAAEHPSHGVTLRRTGRGDHAEWVATPAEAPQVYELRFVLPRHLEQWISADEDRRRARMSVIKADFLSAIMIYYLDGDGIRACQLTYEPRQLRR